MGYISINICKVRMQIDTGADSTVISSKMMTELGKPQLDGKIRHLKAHDGHQLTLLGSLTCDVEWNGSRLTTEHLHAVKCFKAHVKMIPGSQPMFCKARKKPPLFKTMSQRSWTIGQTGHPRNCTDRMSH